MYQHLSPQDLQNEYSPSSCVGDIGPYIQQYITQSHSAKTRARAEGSVRENLSYGSHPDEVLDLYLPTEGNTQKLQVYIHGGYWQELSKEESAFAATTFQREGCYFAVIDYSLAPQCSLSEIVAQVQRALVYLYLQADSLGFKSSEMYISGSSAGAHLAMMMLYTQWQSYFPSGLSAPESMVQGVCAVSGIYDIRPLLYTTINEPLQLSEDEVSAFSPLFLPLPEPDAIPEIIFAYGDNETSQFKCQTHAMAERLESLAGEPIKYPVMEIAGRNHFDVIVDLANIDSWLCRQVLSQMGL